MGALSARWVVDQVPALSSLGSGQALSSARVRFLVCTAEELEMVGEVVDGIEPRAGDVVYQLAKSLPMGFVWSLWICQQIGDPLCQQAGLPSGSVPFETDGVRFVRHCVCVDNLGTKGCSRDEVAR